jgi:hypothetical protein
LPKGFLAHGMIMAEPESHDHTPAVDINYDECMPLMMSDHYILHNEIYHTSDHDIQT